MQELESNKHFKPKLQFRSVYIWGHAPEHDHSMLLPGGSSFFITDVLWMWLNEIGRAFQWLSFWSFHSSQLPVRKLTENYTFPAMYWTWEGTAAKSLQSCLTLCDPIDRSPPGSAVPGILQARTLEWVAISFSNAWKWKVKVKSLSCVRLLATPWTAAHQAPPSMGFSRQEYWSGVPLPSPRENYKSSITHNPIGRTKTSQICDRLQRELGIRGLGGRI